MLWYVWYVFFFLFKNIENFLSINDKDKVIGKVNVNIL